MAELRIFFAYELEDSGERKELHFSEKDLAKCLDPEQVLLLVREDLRRIFIWKGAKSPVKKRFISSRVARDLQGELMKILITICAKLYLWTKEMKFKNFSMLLIWYQWKLMKD